MGRGVEPADQALYESIVKDYSDWPNHYDVMEAKYFLGDIYRTTHAKDGAERAERLHREVVLVALKDIVFDDPHFDASTQTRLNATRGREF